MSFGEHKYTGKYEPHQMADEDMAERYTAFDTYVDLRVGGTHPEQALIEAFEMFKNKIDISNVPLLARAIETNPYIKFRFREVLEGKDVQKELFTKHQAVNHYLSFIKNPNIRESTRLNALNALCAMVGYLAFDEFTKRRVHQTVADFEKLDASFRTAQPVTDAASSMQH